ncbi:MAG: protein-export chaperone SecB [Eubacteriaceae bacterium]
MENFDDIESILKLENLIVNEQIFKRDTDCEDTLDMLDSVIRFSRSIEYIGDKEDEAIVSLGIEMKHKKQLAELEVRISGHFFVQGNINNELKYSLFERNAVTIIFPYLRSQLSIATTQPGMIPVVLPAINILSLLEKNDN